MTAIRRWAALLALSVVVALGGCALTDEQPVAGAIKPTGKTSRSPSRPKGDERPETYVVRGGDTLFGIALDFGLDYRELAKWNGIQDPDRIIVGRQLRLVPPDAEAPTVKPMGKGSETVVEPLAQPEPPAAPGTRTLADGRQIPILSEPAALTVEYSDAAWARMGGRTAVPSGKGAASATAAKKEKDANAKPPEKDPDDEALEWVWPAKGEILYRFGDASRSKGVGIGGKAGQPIVAAADGKVVYSGTGLRGYGKLVIIKHNETYLSVYAHNQSVSVKEGDIARRGQKIAEMGDSDASRVALHFEVRRFGQPVDPLTRLGTAK